MRVVARVALALAVTVTVTATGGGTVAPSPAQAAATPLRITAAGDFGSGADATAVLRGMSGGDVGLALGDLSYGVPGEEQTWCDYVHAAYGTDTPFELMAGNHESNGANGWIGAFAACLPNRVPGMIPGLGYGREYAIDLPADRPLVRVIVISPGINYGSGPLAYAKGDARYAWTERTIDSARVHGIPWVVVAEHKPCLSMGTYHCASSAGGPGTDITTLLARKRVDLVLQGHEHLYQRTHQLRTGVTGCTTLTTEGYTPACVADRDGSFAAGAGTVFATVGTGGRPLYQVATGDPEAGYFAAWSAANANPTHGHLSLDVTSTTLSARFVSTTGAAVDGFTLQTDRPVFGRSPLGVAATVVDASPATAARATATTTTTTTSPVVTAAAVEPMAADAPVGLAPLRVVSRPR